jgi:flagellar protein FlaF
VYRNPVETYESINKSTATGREIEAAVLTKAANKLKECQRNWDAPDRAERLDQAIRYNQRIWSILQAELDKEDNPLPDQIKINLLRLSTFIDQRSLDTLAYPEPHKLNIIININQNIAAGLRTQPVTAAPEHDHQAVAVNAM